MASDREDQETTKMRQTMKSRLQNAKNGCNGELRKIIDGLNEYVEHGLQYVEDADEALEQGVGSIGDSDDEDRLIALTASLGIDASPSGWSRTPRGKAHYARGA